MEYSTQIYFLQHLNLHQQRFLSSRMCFVHTPQSECSALSNLVHINAINNPIPCYLTRFQERYELVLSQTLSSCWEGLEAAYPRSEPWSIRVFKISNLLRGLDYACCVTIPIQAPLSKIKVTILTIPFTCDLCLLW